MDESGPSTTDMKELLREVQESGGSEKVTDDSQEIATSNDVEAQNEERAETAGSSKSNSNDVSELLDEGELLARQGERDEALATFNRAIAIDPTCDMAWFNRGVILEGKGDTLGARQSFAISLDINSKNGPAAANISILLDRIGESEEAAKWANVALHTYPGHAVLLDVMNRTGTTPTEIVIESQEGAPAETASEDEGKWGWSETVAEKATLEHVIDDEHRFVESPETHIDYDQVTDSATEMLRSGDFEGALNLVTAHIDGKGEGHPGLWRVVAGCRGKKGDVEGAIAAYNKALDIDNSDSKSWHNLGVLHRKENRFDHALTCFTTALKLDPHYTKAADNLRQTAMKLGNIEVAISAWEKLLELESEHDTKLEFVNLLISIAQGEATILELSNDLPVTIPEGPQLAAMALQYIGAEGNNAELRARATSLSGDHVSAVAMWKELLQTDNENIVYWEGLVESLESAGDLETAAKCRQKIASMAGVGQSVVEEVETADYTENFQAPAVPQEIQQESNAANVVEDTELLLTPVPVEETQSEIQTTEVAPNVDLTAAAMDAASRVEASAIDYTQTTSSVDNDIEWYNRGLSLITDKKYRESLSCLDKALAVFKDDDEMIIRILNARGNAFYYMEDYPQTVENYHQAMLIDPSKVSGRTLYNMGTAYAEMERYEDAIKCYAQAMPRGLNDEEMKLAQEQTRRCEQLRKEMLRRAR